MSKNFKGKQLRIGVSILTLFWVVFPLWFNYAKRLNEFCEETGLGLQLVPLWVMSEKDTANIHSKHIISYEGDWNADETFWQWIRRLPKDPTALFGPIFFGFQSQSQRRIWLFQKKFPNAFAIDTCRHKKYLMETSERNWDDVLHHIHRDGKICFDTWHVRETTRKKISQEAIFNRIIDANGNIKLVHCQTRDDLELWDFIHNRVTPLSNILHMLRPIIELGDIPIIIEIKPCSRALLVATKNSIENILS